VSITKCDTIKLDYQNGNTAVSFGKTALQLSFWSLQFNDHIKEIRPEREGKHLPWYPCLGITLHIATRAAIGM